MCNVLKLQGRQWALESLSGMVGMTITREGRGKVVATLSLGTVAKPEDYALGVQSVIDDFIKIEARA
ncbi:hypothetical protein [Pseudomonas sp.]|jgi:hypothetical protein|uniref:hypothetical protein n=1 Tax=Pseudomonas sp. TaxID=306 RepID=UPI002ED90654